jgi:two-component system OmpR family response regulator
LCEFVATPVASTDSCNNRPVLRILLVEDDDRLATLTARYLETHDVKVKRLGDGAAVLGECERALYDAVVLDLMLPGKDGVDVCRELRRRHAIPILMVTARGEEVDRVIGLEAGADDYVVKPFSPRELLARIRAQVRRARGEVGPSAAERVRKIVRLTIAPHDLSVTVDERKVDLTSHEFALLRVLADHAGRVLSREQLLERARGSADEAFDRAIDVQISRLRAKLGDNVRAPRILKTVRGVGYMLAAGEEDEA